MNLSPSPHPSTSRARQIELEADVHSARAAREFVRDSMREWHCDDIAESAVLAVSELVTNALVHAASEAEVTLIDLRNEVRIKVRDKRPVSPEMRVASEEDTNGRGLAIICALCERWGVDPAPPGKVVWLDISKNQEGSVLIDSK